MSDRAVRKFASFNYRRRREEVQPPVSAASGRRLIEELNSVLEHYRRRNSLPDDANNAVSAQRDNGPAESAQPPADKRRSFSTNSIPISAADTGAARSVSARSESNLKHLASEFPHEFTAETTKRTEESGFTRKRNFFEKLSSPDEHQNVLLRRTGSNALRSDHSKAKTCFDFPQPEPKAKKVTVVKEGPIDRVKLVPPNKKLPKHWKPKYLMLTNQALFFAENSDVLLTMKSGNPGTTDNVDLKGAHLTRSTAFSSKKNIINITNAGYVALIQNDNSDKDEGWYRAILSVVDTLYKSMPRPRSLHQVHEDDRTPLLGNDLKRSELKKLINRRPTMEALVNKGIYKDEPIFGNYLDRHYMATGHPVPEFVTRCIAILEQAKHIVSDGIYRTSGNMSHIQSLRLQVDQNNMAALDQQKDTDVLAGALKLFFRELKAPLIPYYVYKDILNILSGGGDERDKVRATRRELQRELSPSHLATLHAICRHLVRVTEHGAHNKMDAKNLAIVWGPTVTWSEEQCMFQCTEVNRALEFLLVHAAPLFGPQEAGADD